MDLRTQLKQTLPWLLQKRTLWIALAMVLLYPPPFMPPNSLMRSQLHCTRDGLAEKCIS